MVYEKYEIVMLTPFDEMWLYGFSSLTGWDLCSTLLRGNDLIVRTYGVNIC